MNKRNGKQIRCKKHPDKWLYRLHFYVRVGGKIEHNKTDFWCCAVCKIPIKITPKQRGL